MNVKKGGKTKVMEGKEKKTFWQRGKKSKRSRKAKGSEGNEENKK